MPKFVIEREVPGASALTEEQIREASIKSLEVLRELGPQIRSIQSYVCDNKIYCIYYSPDEVLLREHGSRIGLPVSRVEAVRRLVDPVNYEAPQPASA